MGCSNIGVDDEHLNQDHIQKLVPKSPYDPTQQKCFFQNEVELFFHMSNSEIP